MAKKKILNFLMLLVCCISFEMQAADNYLHTDKTLSFDNTKYTLGWSTHPQDFQYLQEYFPKGQTPGNFTDMFSIWLFVGDFPANTWVQNMVNSYTERQKTDKICRYQTYKNEGEYMIDCLLGESSDGNMTAVGFNVYRCKNIVVGDKQALLICFYSGQAAGDEITPFLQDLKDRRMKLIEAMINFQMPTISL